MKMIIQNGGLSRRFVVLQILIYGESYKDKNFRFFEKKLAKNF